MIVRKENNMDSLENLEGLLKGDNMILVLVHTAIFGSLISPFIEIQWIQYIVWFLTGISAITSTIMNIRKALKEYQSKRRQTKRIEKTEHRIENREDRT